MPLATRELLVVANGRVDAAPQLGAANSGAASRPGTAASGVAGGGGGAAGKGKAGSGQVGCRAVGPPPVASVGGVEASRRDRWLKREHARARELASRSARVFLSFRLGVDVGLSGRAPLI